MDESFPLHEKLPQQAIVFPKHLTVPELHTGLLPTGQLKVPFEHEQQKPDELEPPLDELELHLLSHPGG